MATRASVKASGEMVPEVNGVDKELDPHITCQSSNMLVK